MVEGELLSPDLAMDNIYEGEYFWRDHYDWLKSIGYTLRDRYRPGHSFKFNGPEAVEWEDGAPPEVPHIMDATRQSDGAHVALKRVDTRDNRYEKDAARFLGMGRRDPANHCIPLLDVLDPPDAPYEILLVTPIARAYDDPKWDTFGEAVECIRQIFEGIDFMHRNHVAHRDCSHGNIMMDPSTMWPDGFHYANPSKRRDWKGKAGFVFNAQRTQHYTRTQRPPRYWLIDFGNTLVYDPARGPPSHPITRGRDRSVPEYAQPKKLFDPYAIDVYLVGNWVRVHFMQRYYGLEFMEELVADMTHTDPAKRIKMAVALQRLEEVIGALNSSKLRSRVVRRDENPLMAVYRTVVHVQRRVVYTLMRVSALPRPPEPDPVEEAEGAIAPKLVPLPAYPLKQYIAVPHVPEPASPAPDLEEEEAEAEADTAHPACAAFQFSPNAGDPELVPLPASRHLDSSPPAPLGPLGA